MFVELPDFHLDRWLARFLSADTPVTYNLAASAGPSWVLRDVAALGTGQLELINVPLAYSSASGSKTIRQAIGDMYEVDPDWVVVTAGGSEALSLIYCVLERAGARITIPEPGYPAYAALADAWRLGTDFYRLDRDGGTPLYAS